METEWKRSRATECLGTGLEVSGHCQQPAMTPEKEILQALCSDREHTGPEQIFVQKADSQCSLAKPHFFSISFVPPPSYPA